MVSRNLAVDSDKTVIGSYLCGNFALILGFISILGRRSALEANATDLEKRSGKGKASASSSRPRPDPSSRAGSPESGSPKAKKERFDCRSATYRTVTIEEFVYTHHCFPNWGSWKDFLKEKDVHKAMRKISGDINALLANDRRTTIEPPMNCLFKAFDVKLDQIKVIILGQDPTPQANQACGLAFSVRSNVDPVTVPSIFNMLVELKWEGMNVGLTNGDLTPWVGEGVLLLNAALTIKQGDRQSSNDHQRIWGTFTEQLVKYISSNAKPSAWILWGNQAQAYQNFISKSKGHYIRTGGHPSPMAAINFFGGNYFKCANEFLEENNRGGVRWKLNPRQGVTREQEKCKDN